MAKKGVSLAIGRGEKLPVSKGAGLTAKGRAKYNRETGSNLKAPAPNPKTKKDAALVIYRFHSHFYFLRFCFSFQFCPPSPVSELSLSLYQLSTDGFCPPSLSVHVCSIDEAVEC